MNPEAFVISILSVFVMGLMVAYSWQRKPLRRKTQLIFTTIINSNFKIQIMALSLDKQKFVNTTLALKDIVTGSPVDATFSDIRLTSSDENIFTANTDVNNDGQLDVVGVSAGQADLNVAAKVSYLNSNGEQVTDEEKTAAIGITVSNPPADGTELIVSFTDQQPTP